MCAFKDCNVCIVGGKWVEHAAEGGLVGPFVGVVAEDDTGRTAGVFSHEANKEASI